MKLRAVLLAFGILAALPALAIAGPSAMSPELGAKLAGKYETPKGSPTAHGIVNVTLMSASGKICWKFDVVGLAKPSAAHIHRGQAGKSGPIVVSLGGAYKPKGCAKAAKATIEKISSNPNAYYVNVHTAKYPAGAIRGQLIVGMVHM